MRKFVPLTIDLVEEGELISDFNDSFRDLQTALIDYVAKHGENAEKAKAVITLKVTLGVASVHDDQFTVASSLNVTMPKRPTRASLALSAVDDDGVPSLFARASGTTKEEPRQQRLCTEDGRAIGTDGEVTR